MNSNDIEIKIPAAIAALPLAIGEKIVLAHIANFPGCSNARLAKQISATCRGVENLLRRLRRQGYIEQSGNGRARRHRLLFHVERHIKGGDNEVIASNAKSHIRCGDQRPSGSGAEPQSSITVLKKEIPLVDDYEQTLNTINEMMFQPGGFPETILFLYRGILKRVENEAPESAAKDAVVRALTLRRDAFATISFALRMPKQYHRPALKLINNATPEKLAQLRQRVEAGQLDSKTPLLLAALGE